MPAAAGRGASKTKLAESRAKFNAIWQHTPSLPSFVSTHWLPSAGYVSRSPSIKRVVRWASLNQVTSISELPALEAKRLAYFNGPCTTRQKAEKSNEAPLHSHALLYAQTFIESTKKQCALQFLAATLAYLLQPYGQHTFAFFPLVNGFKTLKTTDRLHWLLVTLFCSYKLCACAVIFAKNILGLVSM